MMETAIERVGRRDRGRIGRCEEKQTGEQNKTERHDNVENNIGDASKRGAVFIAKDPDRVRLQGRAGRRNLRHIKMPTADDVRETCLNACAVVLFAPKDTSIYNDGPQADEAI